MQNLLDMLLGSGFIIGAFGLWLTWKNQKSERRINWYDRSIKEIERLETKLKKANQKIDCLEKEVEGKHLENKELKRIITGLQEVIEDIQDELSSLKKSVEGEE